MLLLVIMRNLISIMILIVFFHSKIHFVSWRNVNSSLRLELFKLFWRFFKSELLKSTSSYSSSSLEFKTFRSSSSKDSFPTPRSMQVGFSTLVSILVSVPILDLKYLRWHWKKKDFKNACHDSFYESGQAVFFKVITNKLLVKWSLCFYFTRTHGIRFLVVTKA